MGRIDNAVHHFRERGLDEKLFFIEYFPEKTSAAEIKKRVDWLSSQLKVRLKLHSSNFEITTTESFDRSARTRIYLLTAGSEPPAP
jgi:hypothetical protein